MDITCISYKQSIKYWPCWPCNERPIKNIYYTVIKSIFTIHKNWIYVTGKDFIYTRFTNNTPKILSKLYFTSLTYKFICVRIFKSHLKTFHMLFAKFALAQTVYLRWIFGKTSSDIDIRLVYNVPLSPLMWFWMISNNIFVHFIE